jgi:hypothetical protein
MYAKEYKAWITCKSKRPRIFEMFDSFKTFWAAKIMRASQTAVPASMHGYGMAMVYDDDSVMLYGKLITNFGATYATTHVAVKAHSSAIVLM